MTAYFNKRGIQINPPVNDPADPPKSFLLKAKRNSSIT
jgi:hypothetical protein